MLLFGDVSKSRKFIIIIIIIIIIHPLTVRVVGAPQRISKSGYYGVLKYRGTGTLADCKAFNFWLKREI